MLSGCKTDRSLYMANGHTYALMNSVLSADDEDDMLENYLAKKN